MKVHAGGRLNDRQLDGFACTRCGSEPGAMVPDGVGPRGQLFRCVDGCGQASEVSDDETDARDITVAFPGGDVRATEMRALPYDRAEFEALPPSAHDLVQVYGDYNRACAMLRVEQLDDLIAALTELRARL